MFLIGNINRVAIISILISLATRFIKFEWSISLVVSTKRAFLRFMRRLISEPDVSVPLGGAKTA